MVIQLDLLRKRKCKRFLRLRSTRQTPGCLWTYLNSIISLSLMESLVNQSVLGFLFVVSSNNENKLKREKTLFPNLVGIKFFRSYYLLLKSGINFLICDLELRLWYLQLSPKVWQDYKTTLVICGDFHEWDRVITHK